VPPCLCAFLLCLAGCRIDQQAEIATYRSILDNDQPAMAFVAGQALTLEDALALANQHNEMLNLRGEDYLQALIAKDRAAAAFQPTISLAPSYVSRDRYPGSDPDSNRYMDVPSQTNMNVFRGFGDLAAYRAAGTDILQRRALLLDAQANVLLDVADTYFQILRSEKSSQVLQSSLLTQEERVRDMRGRNAAGVARLLDLAQTEAQASQTRVTLLLAQNDVQNGRATLTRLLGVDVSASPLADERDTPTDIPPLPELLATAMANRQDLAAAAAAVESAKERVSVAMSHYYPSVTINFTYFLSRESMPNDSTWLALLSANFPIFSAGVIEADVRTAWSDLRQAALGESLTRKLVTEDVQIAFNNVQSARKRLDELQVQVRAAEEALRQADETYKAGLATNLERLTSQDQLLNAQLQLTFQTYQLKASHLRLLRATGRLATTLPGDMSPATRPAL
jgi:outer membrane protein TolC